MTTPEQTGETTATAPKRGGVMGILWHPVVRFVFKLGLAAGLLYWLFASGKLDLHEILDPKNSFALMGVGFMAMLPSVLFATLRFQLLLNTLDMPCGYGRVLQWTMIGQFFNMAMPSATGGDVVKALYVLRAFPREKRAAAVLSVLLDRVLGLFGLFFLALVFVAIGWPTIEADSKMRQLALVLIGLCAGVIVLFALIASRRLEASAWRRKLMEALPLGAKLEKLYMAFANLRRSKHTLWAVLGLSVLNHAALTGAMLILAEALRMDFDKLRGLIVIPLCFFSNVFGVAGGVGVGEAATSELFRRFLNVEGGANLMAVFHVLAILVGLLGIPFYIAAGKPLPQGEIATGAVASTRDSEDADDRR